MRKINNSKLIFTTCSRTTIQGNLFLFSIIFLQISCFTSNPVEFRSIENVHITTVDNKPIIQFDLRIFNPNNWGLRVSKLESDIIINNSQAGKGELSECIRISRKNEVACHLHIVPDENGMMQILSVGFASLFGSSPMNAEIKGELTLRKFLFRKKFPFDFNQKIDSKLTK